MRVAHIHAGLVPGAVERITALHADYYRALAGFGDDFAQQVESGLREFCPQVGVGPCGLWLAMQGDAVHGSIAIDGRGAVHHSAHLRWFMVSDELRGRGAGRLLLREALSFCQAQGFAGIHLWTFDRLPAARHLYEAHGFVLAHRQPGRRWGGEVTEQLFVRGAVDVPALLKG